MARTSDAPRARGVVVASQFPERFQSVSATALALTAGQAPCRRFSLPYRVRCTGNRRCEGAGPRRRRDAAAVVAAAERRAWVTQARAMRKGLRQVLLGGGCLGPEIVASWPALPAKAPRAGRRPGEKRFARRDTVMPQQRVRMPTLRTSSGVCPLASGGCRAPIDAERDLAPGSRRHQVAGDASPGHVLSSLCQDNHVLTITSAFLWRHRPTRVSRR